MGYQNLTKGGVPEMGRSYFLTMVSNDRAPHFNVFYLARSLIGEVRNMIG